VQVPHIIFDDVDLEPAVAKAIFGLYMNTGQILLRRHAYPRPGRALRRLRRPLRRALEPGEDR